jgi:hypothetical protein
MFEKAALAQQRGAAALLLLNYDTINSSTDRLPPEIFDGTSQPSCEQNCSKVNIPTILLSSEMSRELMRILKHESVGKVSIEVTSGRADLWNELIQFRHGHAFDQLGARLKNDCILKMLFYHSPESVWVRIAHACTLLMAPYMYFLGVKRKVELPNKQR